MLRFYSVDSDVFYSANDVQDAFAAAIEKYKLSESFFLIENLLPQCDFDVVTTEDVEGNLWIERESLQSFLEWYAKECSPSVLLPLVGELTRTIKYEKKQKRVQAKKWRWHVAHRQQYCCADCSELLHPDGFDIDHVDELRDGGKDVYSADGKDNLQALCGTCHAKKTRKRTRAGAPLRRKRKRGKK